MQETYFVTKNVPHYNKLNMVSLIKLFWSWLKIQKNYTLSTIGENEAHDSGKSLKLHRQETKDQTNKAETQLPCSKMMPSVLLRLPLHLFRLVNELD